MEDELKILRYGEGEGNYSSFPFFNVDPKKPNNKNKIGFFVSGILYVYGLILIFLDLKSECTRLLCFTTFPETPAKCLTFLPI